MYLTPFLLRISANKMYLSLDFELITPADPDELTLSAALTNRKELV